MHRSSRLLLLAAVLPLLGARPARAQAARATVTASATVVERIGVDAGTTTLARSAHGIDVTTPLAVRGRAFVVEVEEDGRRRPMRRSASDVRLTVAPSAAPKAVTYVVSTMS